MISKRNWASIKEQVEEEIAAPLALIKDKKTSIDKCLGLER